MLVYPKDYFNHITEISYEYLINHQLKALILDVDNTLIDFDKYLAPEIIHWAEDLKQRGIKLFIVSNTNKKEKVSRVADALQLDYIYYAQKPLKKGLKKAQEKLHLKTAEIATVGDQIFTDVIGGNRMGMYSILVEPLDKRDILITRWKRPIENIVKQRYLKTKEER